MSSYDLKQRLSDEIVGTPALAGGEITPNVFGDTIALSGTVPTLAAKELAGRIASSLGAARVTNDLVVATPAEDVREDREIRKAIKRLLEWNALVPEKRVEVSVKDGFVTLEGEMDWPFQKEAAAGVVAQLIGVRGLTDALTVRSSAAVNQVEEQIRHALHRNAEIDVERVRVSVHGGKVVLRGMLRTSVEIQAVESAAWGTPGVLEVESHLRSEEELASV